MANNANKPLGESGAYWSERMRVYEQTCLKKNAKILAQIEAKLSKANSNVKKDLEYWYNRLDKNGGISLAAAQRLLTGDELAEFKWDVDDYLEKASESTNVNWIKMLKNASARSHISRLDAMNLSIRNTLESVFREENSAVTKIAVDSYSGAVRHTAAEVGKLFGVDLNVGEIDNEKIQKLIKKPWISDKLTFSDRIWTKKEQMIGELQEELTRSCIYGKSLDETIERMERLVDSKFKNAKYAARRLVVTESAYFRTLGTRDELAELGVEKFQVDLPIDSRSCEVCRAMNGRIFLISEFKVGLNAPPFHPNCENGGIIPVADEDFEEALREAHAADGKPADPQISLEDWEKEFIKEGLTNAGNDGIIKENGLYSNFKPAQSIEEAKEYAKQVLGFDYVQYEKFNLDVANMVNREVSKVYDTFGNIHDGGYLDGIMYYPKKADWVAAYSKFHTVYMKNVSGKKALKNLTKTSSEMFEIGAWSTSAAEHGIRHELGHAIGHFLTDSDPEKLKKISALRKQAEKSIGLEFWTVDETAEMMKKAGKILSYYGLRDDGEFIAEAIAEYMNGDPRETALKVIEILLGKD